MKKSRERYLEHKHGWEIPVVCLQCGREGVPRYDDWTPSAAVHFGNTPTIYAELFCKECGKNLREEAGSELVRLFSRLSTDRVNKRVVWQVVFVLAVIPLLVSAVVWFGVHRGLWGAWAFSLLSLLTLLIAPMIMWFNYQIAAIRHRCPCGSPDYIFLGLLGRSYCYRCSNCGRLLRLRD